MEGTAWRFNRYSERAREVVRQSAFEPARLAD
jgi:hypothetical protein